MVPVGLEFRNVQAKIYLIYVLCQYLLWLAPMQVVNKLLSTGAIYVGPEVQKVRKMGVVESVKTKWHVIFLFILIKFETLVRFTLCQFERCPDFA